MDSASTLGESLPKLFHTKYISQSIHTLAEVANNAKESLSNSGVHPEEGQAGGREARGIIDFGRTKSVASVRAASRNHVLQGVCETEACVANTVHAALGDCAEPNTEKAFHENTPYEIQRKNVPITTV